MTTSLRSISFALLIAVISVAMIGSAFSQRPATTPSARTSQDIRAQVLARPVRTVPSPVHVPILKPIFDAVNAPAVDLRPEINKLGLAVRSQGSRGTCSVFAMTFLLEYMYAKNYSLKAPDFSEEYLNYGSNVAIGKTADGGFFDALDLGYQSYGMVAETLAPYKSSYNPPYKAGADLLKKGAALAPRLKAHFIKKWDVSTGLLGSQVLSIIVQLKAGRPVAAGLRWPKNFQTEKILGIEMVKTPPASGVVDGHSVAFVGYKASNGFPGGGYLIFRNSWGPAFGDSGYGYLSFHYAAKYTNDLVEYVK